MDRWFELQNCVWDSGRIRGKPYPDKYIISAYKIEVHPKDVIVIEDSISGMRAAQSAGIGWIYGLGPKKAWAKIKDLDICNGIIETLKDFDINLLE